MANTGKRMQCRCIKSMKIIIGNVEEDLFVVKKIYPCMIRQSSSQKEVYNYKVYGEEFALSCSETEFKEHFRLVFNKEVSE